MTTTKDPLLTMAEVLELLGVTRSSFDKWRRRGAGPVTIKLPNGHLRFRQSSLLEWLDGLGIEVRIDTGEERVSCQPALHRSV